MQPDPAQIDRLVDRWRREASPLAVRLRKSATSCLHLPLMGVGGAAPGEATVGALAVTAPQTAHAALAWRTDYAGVKRRDLEAGLKEFLRQPEAWSEECEPLPGLKLTPLETWMTDLDWSDFAPPRIKRAQSGFRDLARMAAGSARGDAALREALALTARHDGRLPFGCEGTSGAICLASEAAKASLCDLLVAELKLKALEKAKGGDAESARSCVSLTLKLAEGPASSLYRSYAEAFAVFRINLATGARSVCRLVGLDDLPLHRFWNAGGDRSLGARRRAAVRSFPLLAATLVRDPDLRREIDAGREAAGLLSELYGLSETVLRSVRSVPVSQYGPQMRAHALDVLRACSTMSDAGGTGPPLPQSRQEWETASRVLRQPGLLRLETSYGLGRSELLSGSGRSLWQGRCPLLLPKTEEALVSFARSVIAPSLAKEPGTGSQAGDIARLLNDLTSLSAGGSQSPFGRLLVGSRGLDLVSEDRTRTATEPVPGPPGEALDASWPAFMEAVEVGPRARRLRLSVATTGGDVEALAAEASPALRSRVADCLSGTLQLVAARDADGALLGVHEVLLLPGTGGRGPGHWQLGRSFLMDRPGASESRDAARALVQRFEERRRELDPVRFSRSLRASLRPDARTAFAAFCGGDPGDRAWRQAALLRPEIVRLLPESLRDLDLEAFAVRSGLNGDARGGHRECRSTEVRCEGRHKSGNSSWPRRSSEQQRPESHDR